MPILIPTDKMSRLPALDLINNNAIDKIQFNVNKQTAEALVMPEVRNWDSLTYAEDKGLFVAICHRAMLPAAPALAAYSADGESFSIGEIPDVEFNAMTYAEDKGAFVAVGSYTNASYTGQLAYSFDGKVFTDTGRTPAARLESIVYAPDKGLFVAVGYEVSLGTTYGRIIYSTEVDWSTYGMMSNAPVIRFTSIAYSQDKSLFVAVGRDGVAYSTDGKIFTAGTTPFGLTSITYAKDKGLFVATGYYGAAVAYSADGKTFIAGATPVQLEEIVYAKDKGLFVATDIADGVAYSADGKTFIAGATPRHLASIAYAEDKGLLLAVSNGSVVYSTDGIHFTDLVVSHDEVRHNFGIGDDPHMLTGNELLTANTHYENIPMTQYVAEKIIDKWKDGRMTVDIDTYYTEFRDENNNIVYTGADGKLIKLGDEIILWETMNGKNEPYITNADGSVPRFRVTSSEFSYKGIPRLRLQAIEVK